ncbi:MAG TPA: ATP-binding protein, partial [Acidimicrobiales bacterium]
AWTALAIDGGSAVAEAAIAQARRSACRPIIAAVEAISGATMGLLAVRSIGEFGWERGATWSCGSNDWRASGASVTSLRPAVRLAGLVAQSIPYLAGPSRPGGRQLRRQMLPELITFAVQGVLLTDSLRWRARQIDAGAADLAGEQTRLTLTLEEAALRRDVLSSTIETLTTVRDLLGTDRQLARDLAVAEERRLRSWLEANAALLTATLSVDTADEEAGSEERMRQVSRLVESGMRLTSTVLTLARLIAAPDRSFRTVLAMGAVAGRGVASISLLTNSGEPQVRQRVLALADLAAVASIELLQSQLEQTGAATGWLQSYCVACAATAGTVDGGPAVAHPTAVAIAAGRAALRLRGPGTRLRRWAAATDELISLGSSTLVGRWLISTGIAQSRALTATATALALERNHFDLEARRLRHQAFVHDGAVQVLLWVGKDDLDDDQLRHWIDQELPRLESVAMGEGDSLALSPASTLAQAISDLIDGFRRLGVTVELAIDALPALPPDTGLTIVEILNEALTNVFKHTIERSARCQVTAVGGNLVARVTDDGTGSRPVNPGSGMGTRMMLSLADTIDGDLTWRPTPTGGTEVTLVVPLDDIPLHESTVHQTEPRRLGRT